MKTIRIEIPEMDNAVGTAKWVAVKIERINTTLKVGKTKNNEPCLSYEHWDDTDKNGKLKRYILCFISNSMENITYKHMGDNVYCVYAENDGSNINTYLFDILSNKSRDIVVEYLEKLCNNFHQEYNCQ